MTRQVTIVDTLTKYRGMLDKIQPEAYGNVCFGVCLTTVCLNLELIMYPTFNYIWFADKYGYHTEQKIVCVGYEITKTKYISFDNVVWC